MSHADSLRLFRLEPRCRVLGPGVRAVLWLQGCSLACPGCLVPQSWSSEGGFTMTVEEAAEWVLAQEVEGLTFSGGEPMQQAAALSALVVQCRSRRDLGVVCYTGYRREDLLHNDQQELLSRVDLLIDGPYRRDLHADLRWRGSSNQRLLSLTPRYSLVTPPDEADDRGQGLEFQFRSDGRLTFAGVPPWPDFHRGPPFHDPMGTLP